MPVEVVASICNLINRRRDCDDTDWEIAVRYPARYPERSLVCGFLANCFEEWRARRDSNSSPQIRSLRLTPVIAA